MKRAAVRSKGQQSDITQHFHLLLPLRSPLGCFFSSPRRSHTHHPPTTNSKLYDRVRIEPLSENKSWWSIWVHPKTAFEPYHNPKNSPLGPQKAKNYPKIRSTLKVRIQGSIGNKSYSAVWVDPRNVFEPYPNPKNSPLGPQKAKNDPKIRSTLKVIIQRSIENKSYLAIWVDPNKIL